MNIYLHQDVHHVNTFYGKACESLNTEFSSIPFKSYYLDGCSGSSQTIIDIVKSIFTEDRFKCSSLIDQKTIRLDGVVENLQLEPCSTSTSTSTSTVRSSSSSSSDTSLSSDRNDLDYNLTPKVEADNRNKDDNQIFIDENQYQIENNEIKENLESIENEDNKINCFSIGFTLTNAGGQDTRLLVDRDQDVTKFINLMGQKYGFGMSYIGDDPESYGLGSSPTKREGDIQTTWVILNRK